MIESIGFLAAIFTTFSSLPQAIKIYKTKNTHDLAFLYFFMLCVGVLLWLIYGIGIDNKPVYIANGITLCLVGYILIIKIKNMALNKMERRLI